MQLVLLHRNEPDGDLDWSVGSGISIRINIRRKLMLMLMSLLPSLAHKLLMLMFMLMLASLVRTGLKMLPMGLTYIVKKWKIFTISCKKC